MITFIEISRNTWCDYEDRDLDSDNTWDRLNEYYSHEIHGFNIVNERQSRDFCINYKPVPHKPYYLLYAVYSTGDSFHREEGLHEYLDLYENREDAEKAKKEIFDQRKSSSITYTSSCGKELTFGSPWYGYFDFLDSTEIEEVRLC